MEINQIHKNVVLTVDPITNVVNIEVTQVISPPVILEVSEVGRKGDQGVKGDTGNDGLSAYQIAINNGTFVGTELEFATMLGSIDEKLDKGNYTGTAEDLNNELQNLKNLDVVLKSVTPTIEGLNISVPVDSFEWRINQVVFDNTPALSAMLTPASDGFYRKDALLGTNTNNYLIVEGVEGDESVTPPTVFPEGTILLGNIDIFGNTVGGFSINDTSRTYVYGNGGATDYVEVTKLGTTLEIMNATSLTGFTIPAKNIQYGKDYYLRNSTGGVLTLKSATGTNGIRFYFPEGDLVVPVNNNVHLKYLSNGEFGGLGYFTLVGIDYKNKVDKVTGKSLISDAEITRLSELISDTQIEVSTSTNIQAVWNQKTILFTANCTIIVPATLLSQYGFVFRTLAGVTVTWAITAPFTWETTPTTTPEKTTGSFMRRGNTNTILLDF